MEKDKYCRMCNTIKPLSAYNKNSTRPDGLQGRCRVCTTRLAQERREIAKNGKECRDCKLTKNVDEFSNDNSKRDKKCPRCRKCMKIRADVRKKARKRNEVKCSRCHNYKHQLNFEFTSANVLSSICRQCREKEFTGIIMKCKKCNEEKDSSRFPISKETRIGRVGTCSACADLNRRSIIRNNKEKDNAMAAQSKQERQQRLDGGRCPIHGQSLKLAQEQETSSRDYWNDELGYTVACINSSCDIVAHQRVTDRIETVLIPECQHHIDDAHEYISPAQLLKEKVEAEALIKAEQKRKKLAREQAERDAYRDLCAKNEAAEKETAERLEREAAQAKAERIAAEEAAQKQLSAAEAQNQLELKEAQHSNTNWEAAANEAIASVTKQTRHVQSSAGQVSYTENLELILQSNRELCLTIDKLRSVIQILSDKIK